jgi:N-methylhydantoinase A
MNTQQVRLGVDVGGTFTDIVLLYSDGRAVARKVLSSPPQFDLAIGRGVAETLLATELNASDVAEYVHGATVATNAIITRNGAATGLITNKGFRDVLEIRRMRMPRLYDMHFLKPEPLVPRNLRREVPVRRLASGEVEVAFDDDAAREVIEELLADGIKSVAVCYLHSYANGDDEARTRKLILEVDPEAYVSLSSEVLPEVMEYERTSTTVINAYVQPVVSHYFQAMEQGMKGQGIEVPLLVMQSNGGMITAQSASRFPVHIIESGPAAGVTGVYHLAKRLGISNAISLDMGGTTAKAAIIEDGVISRSPEYEVGGSVSIGHRLMKGTGYLLRVPSIDIAEVGAGGGSVAWVDEGGALRVGPQSAGAAPGPACYGLGGDAPTITDANVHLGLTSPDGLAGGMLEIHPQLADVAIDSHLASRLGISVTEAAWGVRTVANSSLIRALRAVSTERGRDPRLFVLFAYGGMGPVHALHLAAELGIQMVVIPTMAGVFSALGLLFADTEHHLVRSFRSRVDALDLAALNHMLGDMKREANRTLDDERYDPAHRAIECYADLQYVGQDFALTIPLGDRVLQAESVASVVTQFHRSHEQTYGYRSDHEPVQIAGLRCIARGISDFSRVPARLQPITAGSARPSPTRRAYLDPESGWLEIPVAARSDLGNQPRPGPVLIEEDDSMTVVPADWTAEVDEWTNIVLRRRQGS